MIYFPPPPPTLKLVRTKSADRSEATDSRERAPEQAMIAKQSFDPALEDAWRKLHRARELFEAEQANLRASHLSLQTREIKLQNAEAELALREARLTERELLASDGTK